MSDTEAGTATAEDKEKSAAAVETAEGDVVVDAIPDAEKVEMAVDVSDAGPCRKHLKVSVPRSEIDRFLHKEYTELVFNASVSGFRPGKTPRKLIERRYRKEVTERVKAGLLMQTLDQIDKEEKIKPLNQPNIDFAAIQLPDDGEFVYEFEVEVRPTFDLPEYKGLALKRPAKDITDPDVDKELLTYRKRLGERVVKDGPVAKGDYVVADFRFSVDGQVLQEFSGLEVEVNEELVFRDGSIPGFAAALAGAVAGDDRTMPAKLSKASRPDLEGKEIKAVVVVSEVKEQKMLGMEETVAKLELSDEGQFRDIVRKMLESKLKYTQRQATREQVLKHLGGSVNFELPEDMLKRSAERGIQRKVYELMGAGYTEDQIRPNVNRLRQNVMASTAATLRMQFLLEEIAEKEEITIDQADIDEEIFTLADQTGESPRRVRAKVEKDGLTESLALQALERKTLDKVIGYAVIEDVPFEAEKSDESGLDLDVAGDGPSDDGLADEAAADAAK
ncbi:MAG: trigger factor [Planctomycetia bacterium]